MKIGPYEIWSVESGRVRLDGGAMFGVVPKVLWERCLPADDRNRILLSMRNLVALDAKNNRVILVDTGPGRKWNAKEMDMYGFEWVTGDGIEECLKKQGLSAHDVTDVIVTHLHFDHNGGLTYWEDAGAGKCGLRFPRATHWVHEKHMAHALNPNEKDRASFLKRDFQAVIDAKKFRFLSSDQPEQVLPGIQWFLSHGHTPYQLLPQFTDGQKTLMYCGDLIPTSHHLPVPWIMGYDMSPLTIMDEKKTILKNCYEKNWILAFEHDVAVPSCAVIQDEKGRPKVGQVYALN